MIFIYIGYTIGSIGLLGIRIKLFPHSLQSNLRFNLSRSWQSIERQPKSTAALLEFTLLYTVYSVYSSFSEEANSEAGGQTSDCKSLSVCTAASQLAVESRKQRRGRDARRLSYFPRLATLCAQNLFWLRWALKTFSWLRQIKTFSLATLFS